MDPKKFTIGEYVSTGKKLGKGSYAEVFEGFSKKDESKIVAIKVIDLERLPGKNIEKIKTHLQTEISIMKALSHPNIVNLLDSLNKAEYIYMIIEFCGGGDFAQYLKSQPSKRIPEQTALHWLNQLGNGLKFLRSKDIIHRDLKPQNLLLSCSDISKALLKIADFGFARIIDEKSVADTFCGSPLYMAPEIFKLQKYNILVDLWSVGTIYYEMLYGQPPYPSKSQWELVQKIESSPPKYPSSINVSVDSQDLLMRLLQKDPRRRMKWEEFFTHPCLNLGLPGQLMGSSDGLLGKHRSNISKTPTQPTNTSNFLSQFPQQTPIFQNRPTSPSHIPTQQNNLQTQTQNSRFPSSFPERKPAQGGPLSSLHPTHSPFPPISSPITTIRPQASSPNLHQPISYPPSNINPPNDSPHSLRSRHTLSSPASQPGEEVRIREIENVSGVGPQFQPQEMYRDTGRERIRQIGGWSDEKLSSRDRTISLPVISQVQQETDPTIFDDSFEKDVVFIGGKPLDMEQVFVIDDTCQIISELAYEKLKNQQISESLVLFWKCLFLIDRTWSPIHKSSLSTAREKSVSLGLEQKFLSFSEKIHQFCQKTNTSSSLPSPNRILFEWIKQMGEEAGLSELDGNYSRCEQNYHKSLTILKLLIEESTRGKETELLEKFQRQFSIRLQKVRGKIEKSQSLGSLLQEKVREIHTQNQPSEKTQDVQLTEEGLFNLED